MIPIVIKDLFLNWRPAVAIPLAPPQCTQSDRTLASLVLRSGLPVGGCFTGIGMRAGGM